MQGMSGKLFPDMPCMIRVYRNKKASVHWSAARNTERFPSRWQTGYQAVVNRSLCSSIGLNGISLVRSSGESFRKCFFDALDGTRDICLLGEMFCRRPVLLCPAPPPRRAPRLEPPVVCPGFGFDKSHYFYSLWQRCFLRFLTNGPP